MTVFVGNSPNHAVVPKDSNGLLLKDIRTLRPMRPVVTASFADAKPAVLVRALTFAVKFAG
jgi:hypothetical protein